MQRALLVIDVQESFQQQALWPAFSTPDIVDRVNRLVDAVRKSGDLVVWILHTEPATGGPFDPVSGHVKFMAGLAPREDEPIIRKTSINAFTTTNLQQLLTTSGIRELIVCGIRTEQCCETTTRVASDLGYQVTYVTEATGTSPISHPDAVPGRTLAEILADPTTLGTDEIMRRTEYVLSGRFATIQGVDEVVGKVSVS